MMSETVSIPAKQDFSLFHRGADTTPGWAAWQSWVEIDQQSELEAIDETDR
jgi:hypothetical protein